MGWERGQGWGWGCTAAVPQGAQRAVIRKATKPAPALVVGDSAFPNITRASRRECSKQRLLDSI